MGGKYMLKSKNIFLFFLILFTFLVAGCTQTQKAEGNFDTTSGSLKEFDVIAKQWEFIPSTITVSQGDTVRLKVKSVDVDHGIAIPQLGVNQPVPAGESVTIEFRATQKGQFPLICSVFCGSGI